MLKASLEKYTLDFKRPSGTSRGVLTQKDSWFIRIWNINRPEIVGIGEASIIKTLSPDWDENYEDFIANVVANINSSIEPLSKVTPHIKGYDANKMIWLSNYPSIYLAIETALLDLKHGGTKTIFPSDFVSNQAPIKINGLIWMGSKDYMLEQIEEKLASGFDCIKLKIGAIDFQKELDLLAFIRANYSADQIELRVDANGAFSAEDAMDKLEQLAKYDLHSIEQPIKQGDWMAMRNLCKNTPLPIALDEELIKVTISSERRLMLETILPQYVILKPSLIGGFHGTDEWIALAEELGIAWWITSALESNIGLNAIAQYTFTKNNPLPQGLGTGQLYTNNIPAPLVIENGQLIHQ
ncbi:MAG: o-succinylbenzoate synthase [Crocinitomix sp.]|nr:o-succinylbenzoate synthase [Crocinitomix sp.]